jgi:hypothetical protein
MQLFEERDTYEKALLRVEELLPRNDVGILNMHSLINSIIANGDLVSKRC